LLSNHGAAADNLEESRQSVNRSKAVRRYGMSGAHSGANGLRRHASPARRLRALKDSTVSTPQSNTDWLPPLLEKLDRLRSADPAFLATGAGEHRYRHAPRIPAAWLEWCERRYGIRLPEQYRRYIGEVGNGGAGPWYGLQRFGFLPSEEAAPQAFFADTYRETRSEWFTGTGRSMIWYMPDGAESDGFELRFYDALKRLAGDPEALADPFPFEDGAVPDEVLWREARGRHWPLSGVWWLAHYGCGIDDLLVLNGPRSGEVWQCDFANGSGAARIAGSFAEWYDAWLDHALDFCAKSFNYRRVLSIYATNDPSDARTMADRFRAAGLWCEVEGTPPRTIIIIVKQDSADEARRLIADSGTKP
jgi:hypothetical protein